MTVDISKFGTAINGLLRNTPGPPGLITDGSPTPGQVFKAVGSYLGAIDPGQPASAVLYMHTNPTATNTVVIGTDTYEFLAAGATVANDANIGVVRAGTVAATRTNLINAINGAVSSATGILQSDGSAAARNGTLNWVADLWNSSYIRIQSADGVGGTPIGAADTTVVSETLADASDIWNVGTGNAVVTGRAKSQAQLCVAQAAITASEITAGYCAFSFANQNGQLTPVAFLFQVRSSTGAVVEGYADTFTIVEDSILLTLAGGVGDIAATNVVTVLAACTQ